MTRKESPLTTRAVELVSEGHGLRATAKLLGVSVSALSAACKRAGVVPKRGRRPKESK